MSNKNKEQRSKNMTRALCLVLAVAMIGTIVAAVIIR